MVQPNFEPHYEKFERVEERDQVTRFLELSRQQVDEKTDYLVFPETSFGLDGNQPDQFLPRHPTHPGKSSGIFPTEDCYRHRCVSHFRARGTLSAAVREQLRHWETPLFYEIHNAAIQIEPGKEEVPLYRKSKLVPTEILPTAASFLYEAADRKLEGTTAVWAPSLSAPVPSSSAGKVAPAICCYESVFENTSPVILKGRPVSIHHDQRRLVGIPRHRQHLHFRFLRPSKSRRAIA